MEPHGGQKTKLKICAEVVERGKRRKQVACFISGRQYQWRPFLGAVPLVIIAAGRNDAFHGRGRVQRARTWAKLISCSQTIHSISRRTT